jgi:HAD superfamily hydrolase (TIGR01549 family)
LDYNRYSINEDKEMEKIKGMLFDFGGTIDTNGIHWYNMFREAYLQECNSLSEDNLKDAYVTAERRLGKERIIYPDFTFFQTIQKKIELQAESLSTMGVSISLSVQRNILESCYERVFANIRDVSSPVLKVLSDSYPLVLVSNFYGNMRTVLNEFSIDSMFVDIIESSVVNVRKPDPEIFRLGVAAVVSSAVPSEIVMVGDSADKDIIPAASIGCKTIWLRNQSWDESKAHSDYNITDFNELLSIMKK